MRKTLEDETAKAIRFMHLLEKGSIDGPRDVEIVEGVIKQVDEHLEQLESMKGECDGTGTLQALHEAVAAWEATKEKALDLLAAAAKAEEPPPVQEAPATPSKKARYVDKMSIKVTNYDDVPKEYLLPALNWPKVNQAYAEGKTIPGTEGKMVKCPVFVGEE